MFFMNSVINSLSFCIIGLRNTSTWGGFSSDEFVLLFFLLSKTLSLARLFPSELSSEGFSLAGTLCPARPGDNKSKVNLVFNLLKLSFKYDKKCHMILSPAF